MVYIYIGLPQEGIDGANFNPAVWLNGGKAWIKKEHVDRVLLQNSKNKKIPGRKQNV